jgi:hypothetical protein
MKNFILGVVATLAVLYPAMTKTFFSNAVDTTHNVVTHALEDQNATRK